MLVGVIVEVEDGEAVGSSVEVDEGVDEIPDTGMKPVDVEVTVGVDIELKNTWFASAPAVLTFETIGSRVSVDLITKELF